MASELSTEESLRLNQAVVQMKHPSWRCKMWFKSDTVECWAIYDDDGEARGRGTNEPEAWADAAKKVIEAYYAVEYVCATPTEMGWKISLGYPSGDLLGIFPTRELALESAKRKYIRSRLSATEPATDRHQLPPGLEPKPEVKAEAINPCNRCLARVRNGGIPRFYESTESDTVDHTYPAKVFCEQCGHSVACGVTRTSAVRAWNSENGQFQEQEITVDEDDPVGRATAELAAMWPGGSGRRVDRAADDDGCEAEDSFTPTEPQKGARFKRSLPGGYRSGSLYAQAVEFAEELCAADGDKYAEMVLRIRDMMQSERAIPLIQVNAAENYAAADNRTHAVEAEAQRLRKELAKATKKEAADAH